MIAGRITPTSSRREFAATRSDGSKIKLSVRLGTKREVESSEMEYGRVFNLALLSGLPTQNAVVRELRKNGLWSTNHDEEFEAVRQRWIASDAKVKDVDAKLLVLKPTPESAIAGGSPEAQQYADLVATREKLQDDLQVASQRFNELRQDFEDMVSQTADAKAGDAQRLFLIACVTELADGPDKGKRLWASKDALQEDMDNKVRERVAYEYLMCINNMPSAWKEADEAKAAVKSEAKESQAPEPKVDVTQESPAPNGIPVAPLA